MAVPELFACLDKPFFKYCNRIAVGSPKVVKEDEHWRFQNLQWEPMIREELLPGIFANQNVEAMFLRCVDRDAFGPLPSERNSDLLLIFLPCCKGKGGAVHLTFDAMKSCPLDTVYPNKFVAIVLFQGVEYTVSHFDEGTGRHRTSANSAYRPPNW